MHVAQYRDIHNNNNNNNNGRPHKSSHAACSNGVQLDASSFGSRGNFVDTQGNADKTKVRNAC